MKHFNPIIVLIALLFLSSLILPNNIPITKGTDPVTRTAYITIRNSEDDSLVSGQSSNYTEARTVGNWTPYDGTWLYVGQANDSGTYYVTRVFFKFDTRNLPSDASIISAELRFYAPFLANYYVDRPFIIRLRKWTGDTPITPEDFTQYDTINYDDGSFNASNTVDGWNSINIVNFRLINIGGYTKICMLSSRDLNADPPPANEFIYFYGAGGGYSPMLKITYSYTPSGTVFPKWLVGGYDGQIIAIEGNGETAISLTDALATNLDIQVIESGFGYYLIGLTDYRTLGLYSYPANVPRIYKFDGVSFTPLGADGVQIMDICKFGNKFLIGGFIGGGMIVYPSPKLYTYDGVTLKDVTDEILGSFVSKYVPGREYAIRSVQDCGDYILMGVNYFFEAELLKYDKKTGKVEEMFVPPYCRWYGIYPIPAIAYNGKSAVIGMTYSYNGSTVWQYNGTFKGLGDLGKIGGCQDVATNGTHFLIGGDRLYCYDGENVTLLNDTLTWTAIGWNGEYWLLGSDSGGGKLFQYQNGEWHDWTELLGFVPRTIAPGAYKIYVTSQPEVHAKFEFQGRTYTTPAIIACYPGTYFFAVKDISAKLGETPLLFTYVVYEASPPTQIFSATTTLNINSDANVTIVYASGFRREKWQPPPEEGEGLYCLPLIFWILMATMFFAGLYFFIQRETWKTAIPLIPIALWLIFFEPKTPVNQMPIAILRLFIVPPWHLYMAVILTAIACLALLFKK
jgi:hypothetical protein